MAEKSHGAPTKGQKTGAHTEAEGGHALALEQGGQLAGVTREMGSVTRLPRYS